MKPWRSVLGVAGTASLVTAVAATIAVDVPRRIIWNVSASVPLGLYVTTPVQGLRVGELVAVRPQKKLATFMASRRYLGTGVPMLKHIAALPVSRSAGGDYGSGSIPTRRFRAIGGQP